MSQMSNLQVELEEREITEQQHALYTYTERMDFLRGLMNKGLETSIDTVEKLTS